MNKCKFSELTIIVLLIFVMHLMNGAQFLNATQVTVCVIIVKLPLTRI